MKIVTGIIVAALIGGGYGWKLHKDSEAASAAAGDDDTVAVAPVGPQFNADSAYAFTAAQCSFGPRTMNSTAHDKCEKWIISKFKSYGLEVKTQKADLKGIDGEVFHSTNIIASYNPKAATRILVSAHWDSRPWADNDPDSTKHNEPVMAANDGASGVAVMLELARVLSADKKLSKDIGVDFVCFDAEDSGKDGDDDSWALGAQYFAAHQPEGLLWNYGILLDMVGGEGAQFYEEQMSSQFAPDIVTKVWNAAAAAGYSSYFPTAAGGAVTDDHIPLNKAGIPTVDIIPFYRDLPDNSFGPTWHTTSDTMEHIDKNTLKAVGQTVVQVLYSEQR